MNGLQGRMLYMPPDSQHYKNILLVYDRLGSIEEWWELVRVLNRFGAVTKADLPGFGGMESFYKIHERPTIDRLADYMAAFIKLRYKRKQITIVGIGFGFVVVTRMLQRYPDVAKKVDLVIDINGYAHKEDFKLNPVARFMYKLGGWLGSQRLPAPSLQLMGLRSFFLKWYYLNWPAYQNILDDMDDEARALYLSLKISSWQHTNLRTHLATLSEIMSLDNCKKPIPIPLWHVPISSENKLDQNLVEQHLRVTYKDFHQVNVKLSEKNTALLDTKSATRLLPAKLRRILAH
jgi:pimeloyl-ACP methyl ester carboxylesterase